jgi:hypothetical protein
MGHEIAAHSCSCDHECRAREFSGHYFRTTQARRRTVHHGLGSLGHGGVLQLAALEYVVIKGDWDARQVLPQSAVGVREIPVPPMLFGQEFNFTNAPNRYGLPPFYSLDAWIWKDNPAGTFAMWNPTVLC